MTDINEKWMQKQRLRWMHPNANLHIRGDAYRFMAPDAPRVLGKNVIEYFHPNAEAKKSVPRHQRKFDSDQPRVPAGEPDGGQWTGGDGRFSEEPGANDGLSTDFSAARRRVNEAECEAQYKRDQLICNLVKTLLCWQQANQRYASCLGGSSQLPPLNF